MRTLVGILCLLVATGFPVLAAERDSSDSQKAERERKKACNDQAKGLKGDERKDFIERCLKGEDAAKKPAQQSREQPARQQPQARQDKKADCPRDADKKRLRGDEYKKFMKACLDD